MNRSGHRFLGRPGGPVGVVFWSVAAACALWIVGGIIDALAPQPPPPDASGLVSPGGAALALGAVTAGWAILGWWAITRASSSAVTRLLVVLLLSGPVGVGLGFIDSVTVDLMNADYVGPILMTVCLLVAPFMSVVGVIAALVELLARRRRRAAKPFGI